MWMIQSINYASYNLILVIPVLVTLKKLIKNKNKIKYISIFTRINYFYYFIINIFLINKYKFRNF